ncbi:hypothetical protein BT69DRAFT_1315629 [Atractiella rhizophila]|nr:hypothetical protein BT69DRAFT_1315629 [Atractiella rhizophila]
MERPDSMYSTRTGTTTYYSPPSTPSPPPSNLKDYSAQVHAHTVGLWLASRTAIEASAHKRAASSSSPDIYNGRDHKIVPPPIPPKIPLDRDDELVQTPVIVMPNAVESDLSRSRSRSGSGSDGSGNSILQLAGKGIKRGGTVGRSGRTKEERKREMRSSRRNADLIELDRETRGRSGSASQAAVGDGDGEGVRGSRAYVAGYRMGAALKKSLSLSSPSSRRPSRSSSLSRAQDGEKGERAWERRSLDTWRRKFPSRDGQGLGEEGKKQDERPPTRKRASSLSKISSYLHRTISRDSMASKNRVDNDNGLDRKPSNKLKTQHPNVLLNQTPNSPTSTLTNSTMTSPPTSPTSVASSARFTELLTKAKRSLSLSRRPNTSGSTNSGSSLSSRSGSLSGSLSRPSDRSRARRGRQSMDEGGTRTPEAYSYIGAETPLAPQIHKTVEHRDSKGRDGGLRTPDVYSYAEGIARHPASALVGMEGEVMEREVKGREAGQKAPVTYSYAAGIPPPVPPRPPAPAPVSSLPSAQEDKPPIPPKEPLISSASPPPVAQPSALVSNVIPDAEEDLYRHPTASTISNASTPGKGGSGGTWGRRKGTIKRSVDLGRDKGREVVEWAKRIKEPSANADGHTAGGLGGLRRWGTRKREVVAN